VATLDNALLLIGWESHEILVGAERLGLNFKLLLHCFELVMLVAKLNL